MSGFIRNGLVNVHSRFTGYALNHRARATPEADIKAKANEDAANLVEKLTVAYDAENEYAKTLAAYALNAAHGATLADFELVNLRTLAKEFGCEITDVHAQFAVSRQVVGQIMTERRRQIELFGYTSDRDDANPTKLYDEILSRVQARPHAAMRHALIEAAAILVAEIEHLDRTAPPVTVSDTAPSDGAVYAGLPVMKQGMLP